MTVSAKKLFKRTLMNMKFEKKKTVRLIPFMFLVNEKLNILYKEMYIIKKY